MIKTQNKTGREEVINDHGEEVVGKSALEQFSETSNFESWLQGIKEKFPNAAALNVRPEQSDAHQSYGQNLMLLYNSVLESHEKVKQSVAFFNSDKHSYFNGKKQVTDYMNALSKQFASSQIMLKRQQQQLAQIASQESKALFNRACDFLYGHSVEVDREMALTLLQQAAAEGFVNALTEIGSMFKYERGFKQDLGKAFQCYQWAVELGSARALNSLANMYYYGESVEIDQTKAFNLYRRAFGQGIFHVALNMTIMYKLKCKGNEGFCSKAYIIQVIDRYMQHLVTCKDKNIEDNYVTLYLGEHRMSDIQPNLLAKIKTAAGNGSAAAQLSLYLIHEHMSNTWYSKGSSPFTAKQARKYLSVAVEQGYPVAIECDKEDKLQVADARRHVDWIKKNSQPKPWAVRKKYQSPNVKPFRP
jgi:TPR repeat protein